VVKAAGARGWLHYHLYLPVV